MKDQVRNKSVGLLIGYARVSTLDQNPELQIQALEKAGVDPRHIFREKISGAATARPELDKALEYLREGDALVVWKLDRLGRSLKDLIKIIQDLKDRGVGFKSLTEGIDTTHPGGMLVFHIFGALAQFERELIRERTIAGLEAAKKKGRRGGRPKAIDDDKREIMKRLIDEGKSKNSIANVLGVSRFSIYRDLKR